MDTEERKKLIAQYRDGYAAIAEALLKITPEELDARPAPNKWTTREIIHHLADSETTLGHPSAAAARGGQPQIHGYDQEEFARRLHYERPHETSLELFRYARMTAELLDARAGRLLREGDAQRKRALHGRRLAAHLRRARRTSMRARFSSPAAVGEQVDPPARRAREPATRPRAARPTPASSRCPAPSAPAPSAAPCGRSRGTSSAR